MQRPASSVMPPPLIALVYRRADYWAACRGLHTVLHNEHAVAFPLAEQYSLVSSALPRSVRFSARSPLLSSHFSPRQPFATLGSSQRQEQNRPSAFQHFRRGEQHFHRMSNGNNWGAWEREFGKLCASSCSPTPLTTVYTPPASCTDNWTPVHSFNVDGGYTVSLTRNVTAADCAPTQWIQKCQNCSDMQDSSNISPGVCPEGAPAASTGIEGGVTTHYCCPL